MKLLLGSLIAIAGVAAVVAMVTPSAPRTVVRPASAFVSEKGVRTGEMAPNFTLPGSDGKKYTLSDFKGKVVVLEWLNHECPIDSKEYSGGEKGNLPTLQREAQAKGVVWLSIISSGRGQQGYVDAAGANADIATYGASPTAVLLDPDGMVGHFFEAKTTPHMFIIDKDGIVVYQGALESENPVVVADMTQSEPYFKNALAEVLAGKKVAESETRPYGCAVKYVYNKP